MLNKLYSLMTAINCKLFHQMAKHQALNIELKKALKIRRLENH